MRRTLPHLFSMGLASLAFAISAFAQEPGEQQPPPLQPLYSSRYITPVPHRGMTLRITQEFAAGNLSWIPLKRLSEKQLGEVRRLLDLNRLDRKVKMESNSAYDFNPEDVINNPDAIKDDEKKDAVSTKKNNDKEEDSPDEQDSEKDDEQDNPDTPTEASLASADHTAANPEDAECFLNIDDVGITFAVVSKNSRNAVVELILRPTETNLHDPGQSPQLHFLLDENSLRLQLLGPPPFSPDFEKNWGQEIRSAKTHDGRHVVVFRWDWSRFYLYTGTIPLKPYSAIWEFNIFRWVDNSGASANGDTPGSPDLCQLAMNPVPRKRLSDIKRGLISIAIKNYWDPKKGCIDGRFRQLVSRAAATDYWMTVATVPRQFLYMTPQSYAYLAKNVEKLFEDLDNAAKEGQKIKEDMNNDLLLELKFPEWYERFATPYLYFDKLRNKTMRDHVFSKNFGKEDK